MDPYFWQLYKKKEFEPKSLYIRSKGSDNQSFKTRTGPAGRPGTRPTRAWDRSGWRQKPAWELAW